MLVIRLPGTEFVEAGEGTFVSKDAVTLEFEHSLRSISKWEEMYKKPFFGKEDKTNEETISYVHLMLLTENPPENFIHRLTSAHFEAITSYINEQRTATWFRENPNKPPSSQVITSELVYYWMVQHRIPFIPCEDWNFSRLLTLIRIAFVKETETLPKKTSKASLAQQYQAMNAKRLKELGTTG